MTPELRDSAPFGAVFSDHMLVADYANGKWGDPKIIPYGVQLLAAAPAVAHYGQGIFEGFKAFPRPNGGAVVFRPQANHARMARTCQRMAMPEVPASIFIDGTLALVALDRSWIPEKDGSALYIRPVLFGTGAAKCGGNYAGSMLASIEAQKKGFHNVLWLDGIERKYVEEAGLMNVAFVIGGTVVTPPLGGTILPGITRDSVLTLLRDMKIPVEERRISIDEVFDAHAKGTLQGAAGIGTAAVIAPLGRLRHRDREITVPALSPDSPFAKVGAELEAIRSGKIADRHNWLMAL